MKSREPRHAPQVVTYGRFDVYRVTVIKPENQDWVFIQQFRLLSDAEAFIDTLDGNRYEIVDADEYARGAV